MAQPMAVSKPVRGVLEIDEGLSAFSTEEMYREIIGRLGEDVDAFGWARLQSIVLDLLSRCGADRVPFGRIEPPVMIGIKTRQQGLLIMLPLAEQYGRLIVHGIGGPTGVGAQFTQDRDLGVLEYQ